MSPPSDSIKTEVTHAVAKGIRQAGPGAVKLVLTGMAKLLVLACALGILLAAAALSGYDLATLHAADATAIFAAAGWLWRA